MSSGPPWKPSVLVRLSLGAAALGVFACLPLLLRETAYTLVLFMFVGQPLFAAGFVFFAWKVFRDLRRKELI
ncbi:MAG: hypothetical protein M3542_01740 [Acidobacteriota bacterium]|jgi:hypothetical protein|nr:hypothetical protein [Acidobacteriota bacterium]MDQ5871524.1 hypothetical protein [Acidobacteriota bacterium]